MVDRKVCRECSRYLFLEEFHKQPAGKYSRTARCSECTNSTNRSKYYKKDLEAIAQRKREYYRSHRTHIRARNARYYQRTKDKFASRRKTFHAKNPEAAARYSAQYRAAVLERIPNWLTEADWRWIQWMYIQSRRIGHVTGVQHHVDHIIPLRGTKVSGLHCPLNLQILPSTENQIKSNKFVPGECTW